MKQIIIIVIAYFFMAALPGFTACSPENAPIASPPDPTPDPGIPDPQPGNGRCLIVYYSLSGNTRSVATGICHQTGGTLLEVKTSTPYPGEYNEILAVARQEISAIDNDGVYPHIETLAANFSSYDIVFICTPLWHGRMATPMQSFLHSYSTKLGSKKLALAVTSAGSGISSVIADARRLCPQSVFTGEALWIRAVQSGSAHDDIAEWLKALKANETPDNPGNNDNDDTGGTMNRNITVRTGSISFTATLDDNETARAFSALLPMTVTMNEMNGNEKYYYLPQSLPVNMYRPGTIHTGDLLLYGSDCMVIFYKTFSSPYSYTRLGKIDAPASLDIALSGSNVTVTFESNK